MEKKSHQYQLTLSKTTTSSNDSSKEQLELNIENHDELFSVISRIQEKDPFNDKMQAAEFALGLKLFSEVMLRNRKHPLFEELQPAFGAFMKRLKAL